MRPPDKFNMVDMEGIDIITSQGEEIPGLYQKLVESIAQCRYQCIYNWKFDGILIPPTYVEMTIIDDVVWINEGVSVDEEDAIRIYSLERPSHLLPIAISANGDYLPPEGYDGFSSVNVYIPPPVFDIIQITENGSYTPPQGVDGFASVTVNVPSSEPVLDELNVTANGTYTPPSGVDGFDEVVVNVQSGQPVIQSITITQNGTIVAPSGVDGYSPITVNVPSGGGLNSKWEGSYTSDVGLVATHNNVNIVDDEFNFTSYSNSRFTPTLFFAGCRIDVEVGTLNLTSADHRRLITTANKDDSGLIYRNTGKWSLYINGTWTDSSITDPSYFDNSKITIIVNSGIWSVYKDSVFVFDSGSSVYEPIAPFMLGSSSKSFKGTIKSIKIY